MTNTRALDAMLGKLAHSVHGSITKALEPIETRLSELEKREPIIGKDGKDGRDGEKGETGEKGEAGPEGQVGPQGDPGPAGNPGLPGEPGSQGPQGERGLDGTPGKDGRDGADGKDASLVLVSADFAQEVATAVQMLHESPPLILRTNGYAPSSIPVPHRPSRIERDAEGGYRLIYDEDAA